MVLLPPLTNGAILLGPIEWPEVHSHLHFNEVPLARASDLGAVLSIGGRLNRKHNLAMD